MAHIKGYCAKVKVCGRHIEITEFPKYHKMDSLPVRAGKRKCREAANRAKNHARSQKEFEARVYGNFSDNPATMLTGTFRDEILPANEKQLQKTVMKPFLAALRRAIKAGKLGDVKELKYIRVVEHRHGDGRLHIHMLTNIPIQFKDYIKKLWACYGTAQVDKVRRSECGTLEVQRKHKGGKLELLALSKYLTKERRWEDGWKVGDRAWSCSRNLVRPRAIEMPVEFINTAEPWKLIKVPEGSIMIRELEGGYTYGGAWVHGSFLLPPGYLSPHGFYDDVSDTEAVQRLLGG